MVALSAHPFIAKAVTTITCPLPKNIQVTEMKNQSWSAAYPGWKLQNPFPLWNPPETGTPEFASHAPARILKEEEKYFLRCEYHGINFVGSFDLNSGLIKAHSCTLGNDQLSMICAE